MKSKLKIKTILAIATIGIISFIFLSNSFAANTAKISVDVANIRKNADANSTILEQVDRDKEVEILEKTGDWYKIKYNGIEGYLREDLLTIEGEVATETETEDSANETSNTTVTEQTNTDETEQNIETITQEVTTETVQTVEDITGIYTCKENVQLKIIPLINGKDIKEVNQGTKINVLEINNNWSLVEIESIRGWILTSKIEKEEAGQAESANETTEAEEVKEENSTETEQVNEETQAEVQSQSTYIEKTMYVNSDVINLRSGETTSSESLARLTKATEVTVVSENNGWSKVKVNGIEGYILSTLLSERKPEVTTSRSLEEPRQEASTQAATTPQTSANTPEPAPAPEPVVETPKTSTGSTTGAAIVEKAKSYIGCKYVYGGTSPSGFDCSGFTQYIYKQFGISLNRTAAAQYSNGVAVSRSNLQIGDLVMFGSSASNIFHVGIYMGNGMIVHAANSSRGVTTDTINSGYYNQHYVGARRIIN